MRGRISPAKPLAKGGEVKGGYIPLGVCPSFCISRTIWACKLRLCAKHCAIVNHICPSVTLRVPPPFSKGGKLRHLPKLWFSFGSLRKVSLRSRAREALNAGQRLWFAVVPLIFWGTIYCIATAHALLLYIKAPKI